MDDIIDLIKAEKVVNELGDTVETTSEKSVFAQVKSVGSKRKYEALSFGLKLVWKFILADYLDYSGEDQVRYDGDVYQVTDTFRRPDGGIELTVARC